MIKNAIQNNRNTMLSSFCAEMLKILYRAQNGINFKIIRNIVAMIAGSSIDWIQIKRSYSKVFQVGKLLFNTSQRTAVEIPLNYTTVGVVLILRSLFPVFNQLARNPISWNGKCLLGTFAPVCISCKPVRENLVDNSPFVPARILYTRKAATRLIAGNLK